MSQFALTRTLLKPTSDHGECPFHSEPLCPRSIASSRGIADGTSGNVRHVTSAKTSDASSAETAHVASANTSHASSSEATHVSYDVSAAETAHVSSATACLCISGKKAAGKRSTC